MKVWNHRGRGSWALVVLSLVMTACGSGGDEMGTAVGGAPSGGAGSGGLAAVGGAPVGGGAGAGTGGAVDACPEARALQQPGGTTVALTFKPLLSGKPLVVGEPSSVPGGEVTPTNLRFYVSELALLRADGSSVPADLVTSTGSAQPYGVALVNLEEQLTSTIRLLAPAGSYTGLSFTFGINDACNGAGVNQQPPLSSNSQMVWPHVAGFLFFRYEALWAGSDATVVPPPSMIHMGGVVGRVFAPRAQIPGTLTVLAAGSQAATVNVSLDEIFRGASGTEPVTGLPLATPEVIAGDHLRQAVPTLPIFTLQAP